MALKDHMMQGESVEAYVDGTNWNWYCTDQRVIKHRRGTHGQEDLVDVSFKEITSLQYRKVRHRDYSYLIAGLAGGILGLLLVAISSTSSGSASSLVLAIGGVLTLIGVVLMIVGVRQWRERGLALRGRGYLRESTWFMEPSEDVTNSEMQEFLKTVRGQL